MSTALLEFLAQEVVSDNMSTTFMVFLAQEVVSDNKSTVFIDISSSRSSFRLYEYCIY